MKARVVQVRSLLFGIAWGMFAATGLVAQPPERRTSVSEPAVEARTENSKTLGYRRVFVPEERIPEFAGRGFFPLARQDFEQLVQLLKRDAAAPGELEGAAIRRVALYATLSDGNSLRGQAVLEIERRRSGAAAVAIAPLNLALASPYWKESNLPASVGVDPQGRFVVLVQREKSLSCSWSAKGQRDPFGAIEFSLLLPEAPVRSLTVDLPQSLQLETKSGLVEELDARLPADGELLALAPPDPGARRWRVNLWGDPRLDLRVTARAPAAVASAIALQQSSVYELTPEGVSLAEEWRLFVQGAPVRELPLQIDAGLQLTAARLNDQPASIETAPGDPASVVLRFSEPILGEGHVVRLTGRAPLLLDRAWRVPRVRPPPTAWRSGQCHLRVAEPLALKQFTPTECAPTQALAPALGDVGQVLIFRDYSPQAEIVLAAARRDSHVRALAGTSIEFGPSSAVAVTVFDLESLEGERFALHVDPAPDWIVDSVAATTLAPNGGEELVGQETLPISADAQAPLLAPLTKSLNPQRRLRLVVKAHRRLGGDNPTLAPADLRAVELGDVEEVSRFVAIEAEPPYRVRLVDDAEVALLDPTNLPSVAAPLVTASPAAVAFEVTPDASGVRARLSREPPNLSAQVTVEAQVGAETLTETYRIGVLPISSRLEGIRVHFSRPRGNELRWRWEETPERTLIAQRLAADAGEEGETWELTFDRPRDSAFALRAECVTEFEGACELAFPSLPQANAQQGSLTVRTTPGVVLALRTQGLKAVAAGAPAPDAYATTYGVYHFEPAQQPAATIEPQRGSDREPDLWVRACRVTSRLSLDGPARHTAVFELENAGRTWLAASFPGDVQVQRVAVDGEEPTTSPVSAPGAVRIPLPPNARFPRIEIEWADARRRVGFQETFSWTAPIVAVPVLARTWELQTAPGLGVASIGDGATIRREAAPWDHRLLGWLRPNPSVDSISNAKKPLSATAPPSEVAPAGWTVHRVPLAATGTPYAVVYRRDARTGFSLAAFLLSVLGLGWAAVRRVGVLGFAAGIYAALALAAPAPYYPLATALFLSVPVAALGPLLALRPKAPAARSPAEKTSATASIPLATATCLGVASLVVGSGVQSGFGAPETGGVAPYHAVLVPVDREGRVSQRDKYVYLPASLYRAFRQAAQRLDAPARPWLVRSVAYEATLAWRDNGAEIGCDRITADFEVEVLAAPAEVVLRVPWRNAGVREESVRLDDRRVPLIWEKAAGDLRFSVNEPGLFRLTLDLEPPVTEEGTNCRLDLRLLATPRASLTVRYPGRIDDVAIPNVLGSVLYDELGGELTAELGPIPTLTLVWPKTGAAAQPSRRPRQVEQYVWLQLQPDALIVDAKWKFLGEGGSLDEMEVLADDNLLFLPAAARGLARFSQVRRGDKQSLRFQFDRPRATPFEFQASFVVQNAVGVGAPAAPWLEIQDAELTRNWLAVSHDSTLEVVTTLAPESELLAETRFGQAWGETAATPQLAYRLLGKGLWSATTRLRDVPLTGEATLEAMYRRGVVEVAYGADLDAGRGERVALRLATSPDLRVERVSVLESGVQRVARWSQDEAGETTVFLNGRLTGVFRLEVRGRAPAPPRGDAKLPHVRLHAAEPIPTSVRVYRSSDVSLRLAGASGAGAVPQQTYDPARGRLMATLTYAAGDMPDPDVTFRVAPNRPRIVRQQLVTTLLPGERRWAVQADLTFQANQGVVDVVRFDVPQSLVGPFTIEPPARWDVRDLPHQKRRVLVIRPEQPLSGAARLRVEGFLRTEPGESLRIPDIEPLEGGAAAQFFVLPRQWQGEALVWEPFGMRAEPLPATRANGPTPTVTYRVVNKPHYGAVLRRAEQLAGDPRAVLVDVCAVVQSAGAYIARATIDLEPAGRRQVEIEMPPHARLIHAAIEDLARRPVAAGERRIAFDLGRGQAPLRLTFLYSGTVVPMPDGLETLAAPHLVDVPVAKTLWTVATALPERRLAPVDTAAQVPRALQDVIRLQALAAFFDLSAHRESALSNEEAARWYLPWARRWEAVRGNLVAEPNGTSAASAVAAVEELDRQHDAMVTHYDLAALRERAADEVGRFPQVAAAWAAPEPAWRAAYSGAAPSVAFEVREPAAQEGGALWGGAAMALLGAWLAAWICRRCLDAEWLTRWLPLMCVLLGLAWWLWLTPALVGGALAAAGAGLAWRPRWPASPVAVYGGRSESRGRR